MLRLIFSAVQVCAYQVLSCMTLCFIGKNCHSGLETSVGGSTTELSLGDN